MGNDDVFNCTALLVGEGDSDAAGVNRHTIVNEKASQALLQGCHALVVKRTR
jgi:stress-induced morphogen